MHYRIARALPPQAISQLQEYTSKLEPKLQVRARLELGLRAEMPPYRLYTSLQVCNVEKKRLRSPRTSALA